MNHGTKDKGRYTMKRTGLSGGGFTLIELLVVISIIALLLSILLPALRSVKEQARRVVCMSNEKQILTGIKVYGTDFDNKAVLGNGVYLEPLASNFWGYYPSDTYPRSYAYEGYVEFASFECPSAVGWIPEMFKTENLWHESYWTRVDTLDHSDSRTWGQPRIISLTSGVLNSRDRGETMAQSYRALLSDWFDSQMVFHRTGYNVGYIDGHVSFFKDTEKKIPTNFPYSYWVDMEGWRQAWTYFD